MRMVVRPSVVVSAVTPLGEPFGFSRIVLGRVTAVVIDVARHEPGSIVRARRGRRPLANSA